MPTQNVKKAKDILSCKPRKYTTSLAIPSSIMDSAPTIEMKTILAGQVYNTRTNFWISINEN